MRNQVVEVQGNMWTDLSGNTYHVTKVTYGVLELVSEVILGYGKEYVRTGLEELHRESLNQSKGWWVEVRAKEIRYKSNYVEKKSELGLFN